MKWKIVVRYQCDLHHWLQTRWKDGLEASFQFPENDMESNSFENLPREVTSTVK